jgi:glycosyltransferase involved in cell wall biosynthesis
LIEHLASDHEVGLLCVSDPAHEGIGESVIAACGFARSYPIVRRARIVRVVLNLVGALRGRPRWVVSTESRALREDIQRTSRDWRPDIVQAEYHVMAAYLDAVPETSCIVIVEHDPGATAAETAAAQRRPGIRGALDRLDALVWRRYEAGILDRADVVVAFSEQDRETLRVLAPETPIEVIGFGIPVRELPLSPLGFDPPTLVFVGSFIHPPNVDAASRLVRTIFPRVHALRGHARLVVVGPDPPEDLVQVAGQGVEFTGYVESVTPYLDAAAVVVVPIRHGGGRRVKVGEALAAGKAVVASELAVEGFAVVDGESVLIAEDDDDFVQAVVRLLDDPLLRESIARRGREVAERAVGWAEISRRYSALYREVVHDQAAAPIKPEAAREDARSRPPGAN